MQSISLSLSNSSSLEIIIRHPVNLSEFILTGRAFDKHLNGGGLPVVLPPPAKIFGGGA
jgi:hypothetical protein